MAHADPPSVGPLGDASGGDGVFARVDHDRARRCGLPETVYAAGKTPEQTIAILTEILRRSPVALATRVGADAVEPLRRSFPVHDWRPRARCFIAGALPPADPAGPAGFALVLAAGTSDLPVAEEALATLAVAGVPTRLLCDVGVAGLHRLLAHEALLREAAVLVVVAGMEGALASVAAGLTPKPVVAAPTSVGYGTSFGGVAALLAMLNSCAAGVAVVNIDNGYGAAVMAANIHRAIAAAAAAAGNPP